jgi:hypothetical protein
MSEQKGAYAHGSIRQFQTIIQGVESLQKQLSETDAWCEYWKREAMKKYPTPEAYDAVCKARDSWQRKAEKGKQESEILLRPSVQWFAEQMEITLRVHDHKGGWADCDNEYLMGRLREESQELRACLEVGDSSGRIIRESADVANFAMMIADNTRWKLEGEKING